MTTSLNDYGDIIELDYKVDTEKLIQQLKDLDTWISVINNKDAINLNGPIDDIGHKNNNKHDKDQQELNDNFYKCSALFEFFDKFPDLARCRAFALNKGSMFGPHRDAWRDNEQFRIVIFLNKTEMKDFIFFYEDRILSLKPGVPYIVNTRKVHGSCTFSDDIYHIVMSLYLTKENIKSVWNLMPNINEH